MAAPSPPLSLFGYGLFIVGAIALMGTALRTTYWIEFEDVNSNPLGHGGLFRICFQPLLQCKDYSDFPDIQIGNARYSDVKRVQGLCITAVVVYSLTCIILGHLVLVDKMAPNSKNHGWVALFLCIFASILAFSGCIHFSVEVGYDFSSGIDWNIGYSLYLAAVSGALSICAGIFFVVASFSLHRAMLPHVVQPVAYPAMHVVAPATYAYPLAPQHQQQVLAVPQYHVAGHPPMGGNPVPGQWTVPNQQQSNIKDAAESCPPPAYSH